MNPSSPIYPCIRMDYGIPISHAHSCVGLGDTCKIITERNTNGKTHIPEGVYYAVARPNEIHGEQMYIANDFGDVAQARGISKSAHHYHPLISIPGPHPNSVPWTECSRSGNESPSSKR